MNGVSGVAAIIAGGVALVRSLFVSALPTEANLCSSSSKHLGLLSFDGVMIAAAMAF
jgi:hypothetical protein